MKILIINGFKPGIGGDCKFKSFVKIIKNAFKKHKSKCSSSLEFITRGIKDIDDFLYEAYSKYGTEESQKLFDSIDFVFIDGESFILPWVEKYYKFSLLFKMCKLTNKWLFASGFGISMQIYYCATNFEDIKVINGNSKGSMLEDIHKFDYTDIRNLARNEVFLDNATGDYYTYKKDLDLWVPIGNIGLHYLKSAESSGTEGALMRKVKTYIPKPSKYSTQECLKSKITERKCKIK